jgi:TetR/AcrR family transcriptional repressor of nem operon
MNIQNADIRQHIIDKAKPIILGKGFSAVGLNELLNSAEVPKGSFYHYFKSKEYFGEALIDSYFGDYLVRLEVLLNAEGMNGAERMMSYWQRWLVTQCGDDAETKCMVVKLGGEVSDLSEPMRLALQRGTNQIISRLADGITEGIADGSLPNDLVAADTALVLYNQWLGATVMTKIWRDQSALESSMCNTERIFKHARPSDT